MGWEPKTSLFKRDERNSRGIRPLFVLGYALFVNPQSGARKIGKFRRSNRVVYSKGTLREGLNNISV